jgi:hypothetical protein
MAARHKLPRSIQVLFALGGACIASAACAAPDEMCAQLKRFASSVADTKPHSVTLRTDWSLPVFTRSCERPDVDPERAVCSWLVEHTSTEFMTINIGRALRCAGVASSAGVRIETLAGTVRAPDYTSKDTELELSFDSGPKEGLPWLTIRVTKHKQ